MQARVSKQIVSRRRRLGPAVLPPDLQEKARQRLAAVGFVLCLLFALSIGIFSITTPNTIRDWSVTSALITNSVISLLIGLIAWKAPLSTKLVMRLGLVYQVTLCLGTSLASTRYALEYDLIGQLTWTAALIIVFPLIIPSTFRTVMVVSLLSAATRPIALGLSHLAGAADPDLASYLLTLPHVSLAVPIAIFGAHVLYGMSDAVATAREIGSYSLESLLGRGGMGEVWRAKHAMLARPAALKLIRSDMFEQFGKDKAEKILQRFEREAQVTARLRSPHTIELFDFGRADDGAFYYAMELLEGLTMRELVRAYGAVPAPRAISFLLQICHSLEEAHRAGLVHRDIKPSNLMLCQYGSDSDFVKVLDFGLVKESARAVADRGERVSMPGTTAGTPGYIAPETYMGAPADHLSDIYSLGCVAFYLITGEKLFADFSPDEAIEAHISQPPTPFGRVLGERHLREMPPELEMLVMDCLAKTKERRPQSVEEVASRLKAINCSQPWSQTQARQWWEEHRPEALVSDRRPIPPTHDDAPTVPDAAAKTAPY